MFSQITREQVLANRKTWIDYLAAPGREKLIGALGATDNPGRCCLGHGCDALGMVPTAHGRSLYYGEEGEPSHAPKELVRKVGLYDGTGRIGSRKGVILVDGVSRDCLALLNDETNATPAQIAEYLRSVIEGGEDTPFIPLSDYPSGAVSDSLDDTRNPNNR